MLSSNSQFSLAGFVSSNLKQSAETLHASCDPVAAAFLVTAVSTAATTVSAVPKNHPSLILFSKVAIEKGRFGVADVQVARRFWGETRNNFAHLCTLQLAYEDKNQKLRTVCYKQLRMRALTFPLGFVSPSYDACVSAFSLALAVAALSVKAAAASGDAATGLGPRTFCLRAFSTGPLTPLTLCMYPYQRATAGYSADLQPQSTQLHNITISSKFYES